MSDKYKQKLWGGRFSGETHKDVEEFSSSMPLDHRLWEVDIQASLAHVKMLGATGILSGSDVAQITRGLMELQQEIKSSSSSLDFSAEDIHSDIEIKLKQKIGAVAGKLHTARSRNDQVTTDTRLYLRSEVSSLITELHAVQEFLLISSEAHTETLLPGVTHLQPAQPVSLAHHLLAYFWMFQRDKERFQDSLKRINILPLGAAALAGTSFPIDREMVAAELGFAAVVPNSLDAVSDRDYVIEFLSNASMMMMHLSRFCEELIMWSSPQYGFVEMSDAVTTGSSIMPQKKNPDIAELIRGRVGRLYGHLMGSLTMMKSLPLSYNRDMQEDKYFLFEGLDSARASLRLMLMVLKNCHWKVANMKSALAGDFSNATDLADELVKKGMSFRQAHEVVGQIVNWCLKQNKTLESLTLAELKGASDLFDSTHFLPHLEVLRARTSQGGTAPTAVGAQIAKAKLALGTISI